MKNSLKSYFSLLLLGYAFTDVVSGKPIYYYIDCFGVTWMKESRWDFFAVISEIIDYD